MLEEKYFETTKAKEITKKSPGRPKLMTGGHITINVRVPAEWEQKKQESGRVWRFIIGKGLDAVLGKEERVDQEITNLKDQIETTGRIVRRLHNEKSELKQEIEDLKKNKNESV